MEKVCFARVWCETRVDFARYNVVFTLTKRLVERDPTMEETQDKRAPRGEIVRGSTFPQPSTAFGSGCGGSSTTPRPETAAGSPVLAGRGPCAPPQLERPAGTGKNAKKRKGAP